MSHQSYNLARIQWINLRLYREDGDYVKRNFISNLHKKNLIVNDLK